jgi:ribonucleoside-triphosphate reductase (formate)
MAFSLQGLNHYVSSYVAKKYWLMRIYPKEVKEVVGTGDFHIHNLDILVTYCCDWNLYDLLLEGFRGVFAKVQSKPLKHFGSALGQIVNFFTLFRVET